MATPAVAGSAKGTAAGRPLLSTDRFIRHSGVIAAAGVLLAAALATAAAAAPPISIARDETERAWYATFMARFNARVAPSLQVDADLAARVSQAWDAMVARLRGGRATHGTPLDQYPLLSFVDDRFATTNGVSPWSPPISSRAVRWSAATSSCARSPR